MLQSSYTCKSRTLYAHSYITLWQNVHVTSGILSFALSSVASSEGLDHMDNGDRLEMTT